MAESLRTAFAHNLRSTRNPLGTDDVSQGYSEGSIWINKSNSSAWICTDGTINAAVWAETGSGPLGEVGSATGAITNGTVAASKLSSAFEDLTYINTADNPGTVTTRTAAQMIADASLAVGNSYILRVCNGGRFAMTLTPGTGVTISGGWKINGARRHDFLVQVTGAAAMTFTHIGSCDYVTELIKVPASL